MSINQKRLYTLISRKLIEQNIDPSSLKVQISEYLDGTADRKIYVELHKGDDSAKSIHFRAVEYYPSFSDIETFAASRIVFAFRDWYFPDHVKWLTELENRLAENT